MFCLAHYLVLNQSALRTGALAPAMAATNAMTLLACIVLGIVLLARAPASAARKQAIDEPAYVCNREPDS